MARRLVKLFLKPFPRHDLYGKFHICCFMPDDLYGVHSRNVKIYVCLKLAFVPVLQPRLVVHVRSRIGMVVLKGLCAGCCVPVGVVLPSTIVDGRIIYSINFTFYRRTLLCNLYDGIVFIFSVSLFAPPVWLVISFLMEPD